jgi:hypothetical protein
MSMPAAPAPAPTPAPAPAAAPQARVEQQRIGTRLRLSITFPVRTRLRRQRPDGRGEPAHFVQSFVIENGSAVAASGHLGPYMAAAPLVEVDINAPLPGEALQLTWSDSAGREYRQRIETKAG